MDAPTMKRPERPRPGLRSRLLVGLSICVFGVSGAALVASVAFAISAPSLITVMVAVCVVLLAWVVRPQWEKRPADRPAAP